MANRLLVLLSQQNVNANGGTKSLGNILTHLEQVDVTVITQRETLFNERLRGEGFSVIVWSQLAATNPVNRRINMLINNIRIFIHLLSNRYGAVHVNDIQMLLGTIFGLRLAGVSPIMNVRDTNEPNRPYKVHWKLLRHCRKVIALSQEMANDLKKRLPLPSEVKERLITFIYSIVDHNFFLPVDDVAKSEARSALGMNDDDFVVLVAAKIDPKKQQLKLIEHWGEHLKGDPRIKLYLVGDLDEDSTYGKACINAVTTNGLEASIFFRGYQKDIRSHYYASDVVLVPSQREGLARCMIEGLCCGVPVISFDVCSAREILEAYACGIVVEQGDYGALLSQLKQAESEAFDLKSMGIRGAAMARKLFKAKEIASNYFGVFFERRTTG